MDVFPDVIYLEKSPIVSVTHMKYYNSANVLTELSTSNYNADVNSEPGRIICAYGQSWPDVYRRPSAIQIRFVAGYGNPADVPDAIKDGIYLTLTHLFENRGDEARRIPYIVQDVLQPYRVFRF